MTKGSGIGSVVCGVVVPIADWTDRSVRTIGQSVEPQTTDYRPQTADHRPQTTEPKPQTTRVPP